MMKPARRVDGTAQIIGLLRRSIGGMPEKWLGDADVSRIMNGEFGGDHFSE
jgi:hypothetical protein